MRYIDITSGKTKKIYGGILQTQDEEITSFRMFQQFKKFIVGNLKGTIKSYNVRDSELVKTSLLHSD